MASAAAEAPRRSLGDAHRELRGRVEAAARLAAPALLGYGAARLLGIGLLCYLAERRGESPGTVLYGSWDARWYQMIAERGYDRTVGGVPHTWHAWSNLAFFPLYPALPLGLPPTARRGRWGSPRRPGWSTWPRPSPPPG